MPYCFIPPASIIGISWQLNLLLSPTYRLRCSFSANLDKSKIHINGRQLPSSGLEVNPPFLDPRTGSQPTCGTQVYQKVVHSQPIEESSAPQLYPSAYIRSMTAQSSGQVSKTGKKCLTERVGLKYCRYFKPETENMSLLCFPTWGASVTPAFLSSFYLGLS